MKNFHLDKVIAHDIVLCIMINIKSIKNTFYSSSSLLLFLSSFFELAGIFVAFEVLLNYHRGIGLHGTKVGEHI